MPISKTYHSNIVHFRVLGVQIYKLDISSLGCGFPLWEIIILAIGVGVFIIVIFIIVCRQWTKIKYNYYSHFTNDDDSQDISQMKYDAFVSYR